MFRQYSNTLCHDGVELPIYPLEEVKTCKLDYIRAAHSGLTSFVRTVRTSGPDETLRQRLNRAHWYFGKVATFCNVKIVPHRWGVCEANPAIPIDQRLYENILPKGFVLAAQVAIIRPKDDIPLTSLESFNEGVVQYQQNILEEQVNAFRDITVGQLVYGTPNSVHAPQKPETWFVDIEPLLGQQILSAQGADPRSRGNSPQIIG